jgi:potassium efflux system protein
LGISSMGIDLSNLAIIAGALSVGIGFGLQNIVNNFVSGLILLFERPINVGDLVAIGEHRGQVRKISVRATEIRTIDNATVFIPHSSLISGALINRTRADKTARLSIPLEIDPGTDPGLIRQAVLKLAEAHPEVCREPVPPAVIMVGFDDLAVYLELVALARDGERLRTVTSELCFSIFHELGQSGVRIPGGRNEIRASLVGEPSSRTPPEPMPVVASDV